MHPLLPKQFAGDAVAEPLAYMPNTVTATVAVGELPWGVSIR